MLRWGTFIYYDPGVIPSTESILANLAIIGIQPIGSKANDLSKIVKDLTSTCDIPIRRLFPSSYAEPENCQVVVR